MSSLSVAAMAVQRGETPCTAPIRLLIGRERMRRVAREMTFQGEGRATAGYSKEWRRHSGVLEGPV